MNYQWRTARFEELSGSELYAILRLRQIVFVVEQRCIYLDLDDLDQAAIHLLCRKGDRLLGYLRCLPPGLHYPESSLGRIVVDPAARGRYLGRELVKRGLRYNLEKWPDSDILINAQAYLRDYYTGLGFAAEGDEYDEDGILHVRMRFDRGRSGDIPVNPPG
jgi:ElaA protein